MPTRPSGIREALLAALLGTAGVLLLLGLAEAVVSLAWNVPLEPYPPGFGEQRPRGESRRFFVYDPALFWRPKPNDRRSLRDPLRGTTHSIRTNGLGLRDDPWPHHPPQLDPLSILSLGDSTTWGDGVEADQTYSEQLQAQLARRGAGRPVQVLNAGVPGYASSQVLRLAGELLGEFSFDAVVIHVLFADMLYAPRPDTAHLHGAPATFFLRLLSRSSLYRLIRRGREGTGEQEPEDQRTFYTTDMVHRNAAEPDYRRNLEALLARVREHGAHPVVIRPLPISDLYPGPSGAGQGDTEAIRTMHRAMRDDEDDYHRVLLEVVQRTDTPVVDAGTLLERAPSPQAVYLDMVHPTARAHADLARLLADPILEAFPQAFTPASATASPRDEP